MGLFQQCNTLDLSIISYLKEKNTKLAPLANFNRVNEIDPEVILGDFSERQLEEEYKQG